MSASQFSIMFGQRRNDCVPTKSFLSTVCAHKQSPEKNLLKSIRVRLKKKQKKIDCIIILFLSHNYNANEVENTFFRN